MTAVLEKFANARTQLRASLIERDHEVDCILETLVAGEHICFIGEPGTAKSWLLNQLSRCIYDAQYFHLLLAKTTNPEEMFGPFDIQGIKESRFQRVTDGYLPTAHIFCGDEFWKASSAITTTILTAMEERKYKHGKQWIDIPLRMTMAASNEWPVGEGYEGMSAMFDRFLVRKAVHPVSPARRRRLLTESLPDCTPCLSLADIDTAIAAAAATPVNESALDALDRIIDELHKAGIRPGDRRMRKSMKIAKAAAWLDGSSEVLPEHLEPLKHTLWVSPEEQPVKTAEIVMAVANPLSAEVTSILVEFDELFGKANPSELSAETFSALKKMQESAKRMDKLAKGGNLKAVKANEDIKARLVEFNQKMVAQAK
jgi:MoxR-like ATPase